MPKTPSYRTRPGYSQAIVTLTDSATGKRRDYWLGEAGSRESRELYHRLVAEWESNLRRLPETAAAPAMHRAVHRALPLAPAGGPRMPGTPAAPTATAFTGPEAPGVGTVAHVISAYWRWAQANHQFKRASNIKSALRLLRRFDGSTPAAEYGPKRLHLLREAMVRGDASGDRPREPWSRRTTNERTRIIVNMFKWAAARELVAAPVPGSLALLEPLKRGRTAAREGRRVGPAPMHLVETIKPLVSRQVAALIDLQLLTGARPGELLELRARDIDTADSSGLWAHRPAHHENEFRGPGHDRVVYFGPKAQEILRTFLEGRRPDAFLFSPAEAEERRAERHAARVTPLRYGNRPGTNRVRRPLRAPTDHYTAATYYKSIVRACDEAFPPPHHLTPAELPDGRRESQDDLMLRLTPAERAELAAWRKSHRFYPYQLRHNSATELRRQFGLEAAQLVLGHSSALVTEAVYAERDASKVADVLRRCG